MILVSDNEGTPLTIIEAGTVGVPTLTRNVGGIKGLIDDSLNGFLVGNSSREIADKILHIVGNRQVLEKVSRGAEIYFNLNYSEEDFLQTYKRIYSSIAE